MSAHTISNRYAQALFDLSTEGVDVSTDLGKLTVLVQNDDVSKFLALPSVSAQDKVTVIERAVALSPETGRFLLLLCERGKTGLIGAIAQQFEELVRRAKDYCDVVARVATKLDSKTETKLTKAIESLLGARISLEVVEDKDVVGGVVLQIGDRQIDCSVRGKLDAMRRALIA